jgi:hypothetical protein
MFEERLNRAAAVLFFVIQDGRVGRTVGRGTSVMACPRVGNDRFGGVILVVMFLVSGVIADLLVMPVMRVILMMPMPVVRIGRFLR